MNAWKLWAGRNLRILSWPVRQYMTREKFVGNWPHSDSGGLQVQTSQRTSADSARVTQAGNFARWFLESDATVHVPHLGSLPPFRVTSIPPPLAASPVRIPGAGILS